MKRLAVWVFIFLNYHPAFAAEKCSLTESAQKLSRVPLAVNPKATEWQDKYLGEYRFRSKANHEDWVTKCFFGGDLSVEISQERSALNVSGTCIWDHTDGMNMPEMRLQATPETGVFDLVYKNNVVGRFNATSRLQWRLTTKDGFVCAGDVNFTCQPGMPQVRGDFKGDFTINCTRRSDLVSFKGKIGK